MQTWGRALITIQHIIFYRLAHPAVLSFFINELFVSSGTIYMLFHAIQIDLQHQSIS